MRKNNDIINRDQLISEIHKVELKYGSISKTPADKMTDIWKVVGYLPFAQSEYDRIDYKIAKMIRYGYTIKDTMRDTNASLVRIKKIISHYGLLLKKHFSVKIKGHEIYATSQNQALRYFNCSTKEYLKVHYNFEFQKTNRIFHSLPLNCIYIVDDKAYIKRDDVHYKSEVYINEFSRKG